ncbi:MAG: hypothetical protein LHV69_10390 [Elusimicrobia bacterium]|nr:hypothetical protein [Candidatus Obscuribacterium magneticum]
MKKLCLLSLGFVLVAPGFIQAAEPAQREKFYGRVSAVEPAAQTLVATNKKHQLEESFTWDERTKMTYKQKPILPSELKVGQYVVISYILEQNQNKAKKIVLRDPPSFLKKSAQ